jgi:hypothetical protein
MLSISCKPYRPSRPRAGHRVILIATQQIGEGATEHRIYQDAAWVTHELAGGSMGTHEDAANAVTTKPAA